MTDVWRVACQGIFVSLIFCFFNGEVRADVTIAKTTDLIRRENPDGETRVPFPPRPVRLLMTSGRHPKPKLLQCFRKVPLYNTIRYVQSKTDR